MLPIEQSSPLYPLSHWHLLSVWQIPCEEQERGQEEDPEINDIEVVPRSEGVWGLLIT